MVREAYIRWLY